MIGYCKSKDQILKKTACSQSELETEQDAREKVRKPGFKFKFNIKQYPFAVFYNYFENEDDMVADCSYSRTPSAFNLLSHLASLSPISINLS